MQRPTAGRRRVRSGAIHATELIGRATGRFPQPTLPPDEAPTVEIAAVPADADEPTSRGMRVAKLAGLALAALTLCGTVATAAVVSRERGTAHPAGPAGPITGQRALLPDALTEAVSASSAVAAAPATPTRSTAASTAIVAAEPTATPQVGTAPAADRRTPPATAGLTDRGLIAEYYRLVDSSPGAAFALLSGTEFGADFGQFINAWSGVTDVTVIEVTTTPDGVLAVVRMQLAGGATLSVRQLFDVTDTTPRRIAGVTLISAQVS